MEPGPERIRSTPPQRSTAVEPASDAALDQAPPCPWTISNQAVIRLLARRTGPTRWTSGHDTPVPDIIQAKLSVGAVDDPLERAADHAADEVLRMSAPAAPVAAGPPPTTDRQAAGAEAEKSHRGSALPQGAGIEAPAVLRQVLQSSGQPLDAATRAYFEPRFGRDFGAVRVHTDHVAAASATAINASAYTAGDHVVFGDGEYRPNTDVGRKLMAHELAHVVQQSGGSSPVVARAPGEPFVVTPQDMDYLRNTMLRFHGLLPPEARQSLERNTTVVIALVTEAGEPHLVYTVASNSTSPAIRNAAETLGLTRWDPEGVPKIAGERHAEQMVLEGAGKTGFKVHAMVVSRAPCNDCGPVVAQKGIPIIHVPSPAPGGPASGGPAGGQTPRPDIDEDEATERPATRFRYSPVISALFVQSALAGIQIWALYNLQKENEAKMKADKKRIAGEISDFFERKAHAIADRWIDFEPVYANFTTQLLIDSMIHMQTSVGPHGPGHVSGPAQEYVKYLESSLVNAEIADRSKYDHRKILVSSEMRQGGTQVNRIKEVTVDSTFLPVDNLFARQRILQRIHEIENEMARSPSPSDKFGLQMHRDELRLKLTVFPP